MIGTGTSGLLDSDLLVVESGERPSVGACGSLLAQLGATVIVIEPTIPRTQGKWRNRAAAMAGKNSVVLADDASLRQRLIDAADVLLLSSDDGTSDGRWWSSPRPRSQIVCDITAFGHEGPLAGHGGSEAIVQALGGVVDTTGPADGPPAIVGAPVLECSIAVFAAASIVAALRVRRLHGDGQRIDMSMYDMAVNELANFLPLHYAGATPTRSGNRHPLHMPWGSYRAKDGHVLICSVSAEQFARICDAIGQPQLTGDPRFATSSSRLRHFRELDALINAWSGVRTVAECERVLLSLGVSCGPIVPVADLASETNLAHRDTIRILRDPLGEDTTRVFGTAISGRPICGIAPSRIPAPDEDRRAVLALVEARPAVTARIEGDPERAHRPLDGVRVVEIGQYTVAPLVARHMGSLGAEVIKVEPPTGDAIRHAAPLRDGESHIFAISNTDKRGIVLDLRNERDRSRLHALLARSDVLVENLRPGALAKLGFTGDTLRTRHTRLVYCSVTGFGSDSAYPGRPAFDTVVQAMSGLMDLTRADGEPMKAGISASDMIGGQFGLLAALAALERRDAGGSANHFDIAMQDATAWMTQSSWPQAMPAPPSRVLRAADGFVVVDGDSADVATIAANGWQGDRASLIEHLAGRGIVAAPVATIAEVVAHPHTSARKLLIERPTRDGRTWIVLGSPLRLLSTPARVRSAMPALGFDQDAMIAEFALDDRTEAMTADSSGGTSA